MLPCPPPSSWGCSVGMLRAPRTPGTRGSLFDGDREGHGLHPRDIPGTWGHPKTRCRVWGHKDPTGGCCQGVAHRISVLGAPEVVEEQQP